MFIKEQLQAAPYRGLPIEEKNDSSSITSVTGETAAFYYSSSGTRTADAGQAAGVAVEAVLAKNNIKNSQGKMQGTKIDSSLSFTSTAFTNERACSTAVFEALDNVAWAGRLAAITAGFSNGDYVVDYAKGIIYGVKASTQASLTSTAYKVNAEVLGTVTIDTTGLSTGAKQDTGNASLALIATAPTRFQNLGANATLNVKASAGYVYSLACDNLNAADRFIQLHNTATTPAGGAVPLYSFRVFGGTPLVLGTDFFTAVGAAFSTGIAFAFSTTEATYTAATAADQMIHIMYS